MFTFQNYGDQYATKCHKNAIRYVNINTSQKLLPTTSPHVIREVKKNLKGAVRVHCIHILRGGKSSCECQKTTMGLYMAYHVPEQCSPCLYVVVLTQVGILLSLVTTTCTQH